MISDEEQERRRLVYKHAKERDLQLWLVGALKVSLEEYRRRLAFVKNKEEK